MASMQSYIIHNLKKCKVTIKKVAFLLYNYIMVIDMVCKKCGKEIPNNMIICPNCGNSMQTISFNTNKLGEDGKRAEYITEKYNMKKGVYEGKAKEHNNPIIGLIIILVVIITFILIAVANYLL